MAPDTGNTTETKVLRSIVVAGDVCLDVVGAPVPPASDKAKADVENWRLAGEKRTQYLRGGAMLLAQMITDAVGDSARVARPYLPIPESLQCATAEDELPESSFDRLTRSEVIHSLLEVEAVPLSSADKAKEKCLRIKEAHGYSGPSSSTDSRYLVPRLTQSRNSPSIVALDDTGNQFRRESSQWPDAMVRTKCAPPPLVVLKLHRPFPGKGIRNPLWNVVCKNHASNRIAIVTVDDLRKVGVPISLGLSWERTALDIVWHLTNDTAFAELQKCPRLIVRIGVDGAVLLVKQDRTFDAWLVYDPCGIEGRFARGVPGTMISYGSAFCAALVKHLAEATEEEFSPLLDYAKSAEAVESENPKKERDPRERIAALETRDGCLLDAIAEGLCASRRLLELGFGKDPTAVSYPRAELFAVQEKDRSAFARIPIPIIPGTREPDRAYWRILDSIFESEDERLHVAVACVATNKKATKKDKTKDAVEKPEETGRPKDPAKGADLPEDAPEEIEAKALSMLARAPIATFGKLRTYDRVEIEHYRSLHMLLCDYLSAREATRPFSLAVFGPPGAGKSFGVRQVAESLAGQRDCRKLEVLTFNLSLYQRPGELSGAFHLVRDVCLRGKVPLVFFDEFDSTLESQDLGWLRYFLAPMQDGLFLDRGQPHPIGQAIFVFAGGTCATFREFATLGRKDEAKFRKVKGPDFLSRLRATLDIPSIDIMTPQAPEIIRGETVQRPGTFNPYGPIEEFPCPAAVLLRRAGILAFNLKEAAPDLKQPDDSLNISPQVLRALLHLPRFNHGNRSFGALLDMSHLAGATLFCPALFPAPFQTPLHANDAHIRQLVSTALPFEADERETIAKAIHADYQKRNGGTTGSAASELAGTPWDQLSPRIKSTNLEQADDIPNKLRRAGFWIRKKLTAEEPAPTPSSGASVPGPAVSRPLMETLAKSEHDRWSAQKRRQGWIAGDDTSDASRRNDLLRHNCLFPWEELTEEQRQKDRDSIQNIPDSLAAAGYEIVKE